MTLRPLMPFGSLLELEPIPFVSFRAKAFKRTRSSWELRRTSNFQRALSSAGSELTPQRSLPPRRIPKDLANGLVSEEKPLSPRRALEGYR
jgi:hypothetical protein